MGGDGEGGAGSLQQTRCTFAYLLYHTRVPACVAYSCRRSMDRANRRTGGELRRGKQQRRNVCKKTLVILAFPFPLRPLPFVDLLLYCRVIHLPHRLRVV